MVSTDPQKRQMVLELEQLDIKQRDADGKDVGGGYNQKTVYCEGTIIIGQTEFWLTPVIPDGCLLLGGQVIQISKFHNSLARTWDAVWYYLAVSIQAIATGMDDEVGTKAKKFFDSFDKSPIVSTEGHIKIVLSGISDSAGKVIGFMHYIEMPDMQLP